VQGAELFAGFADEVAFADEDLVGLCRFARYAEAAVVTAAVRPG
jgi:hypothetical protein